MQFALAAGVPRRLIFIKAKLSGFRVRVLGFRL